MATLELSQKKIKTSGCDEKKINIFSQHANLISFNLNCLSKRERESERGEGERVQEQLYARFLNYE